MCLAASRYSSGSGGRSDSSVSSARRTVVCGSPSSPACQPRGEVAPHLRQVHLAGRGSPQLAVQRVRQARHQRAGGALDGDQTHLLGGGEVLAPHQVGKHVHVDRFVLRQRVDHQCDRRHQPVQLVANQIAHALRDRDVTVPDPHPGHLADPARGHLILDQPLQEQGVAAGEPPEPLRAARVDRTVQGRPRPSVRAASGDNGSRSRRASSPSFHNAFTASGSVPPVRTVTTRRASRVCASWCTTCAENSSSRWASSTPSTSRPPRCWATSELITRRTLGTGSETSSTEGRGEGAQRNRPGRSRPDHPVRPGAGSGGLTQQFSRESRLANARRTGYHHTREIADPAQRPAQGREFTVPPGQRITADHAPTITLSGARDLRNAVRAPNQLRVAGHPCGRPRSHRGGRRAPRR